MEHKRTEKWHHTQQDSDQDKVPGIMLQECGMNEHFWYLILSDMLI